KSNSLFSISNVQRKQIQKAKPSAESADQKQEILTHQKAVQILQMASRTVSLIQDQNLNVQFNGKANISKALRKASTGGRKPLGDLSNSVNPTAKQISKKENSKIITFTEKETVAFKLPNDSSRKKSVPKASEKVQASGRKALSDISNSGKPHLQGTSKNQTAKLCIPEDISEEGFLHNHEECIKAQKRAISTNEFLRILGLDG
ncbi:hypothetical protein Gorai_005939, partial [Gossypium raimondii]|nr:hypothetical protein [Gossypium raimondii]